MQVVETVQELQKLADADRAAGRRIALVPTMGALHAGHLALVAEARRRADRVVVSIFVNPAQFDDAGDLERYPRTWESDLEKCRSAGVDRIFAPRAEDVYPAGSQTWVDVTELTQPLCGAARAGHFRGVTTVVAKLLLAAKPHVALFGEKDYQQLAAIRRMALDLGFDTEIVGVPTVRESDGLALSSRNARLDAEGRLQARVLVRAIEAAERAVDAGERSRAALVHLVTTEIGKAPRARLDYADLRCPDSLERAPADLVAPTLLALAVFVDPAEGSPETPVRLIDNRILRPPTAPVGGPS